MAKVSILLEFFEFCLLHIFHIFLVKLSLLVPQYHCGDSPAALFKEMDLKSFFKPLQKSILISKSESDVSIFHSDVTTEFKLIFVPSGFTF